MITSDDTQRLAETKRFRPRFTLRRLLLVMTAAAFLVALASQSPYWLLASAFYFVNAGLLGLLIAAAFAWEGRLRIACVAALIAAWLHGSPHSMLAYSQGQVSALLRGALWAQLVIGQLLGWLGVAATAAAAYWLAGQLSPPTKKSHSAGWPDSPSG